VRSVSQHKLILKLGLQFRFTKIIICRCVLGKQIFEKSNKNVLQGCDVSLFLPGKIALNWWSQNIEEGPTWAEMKIPSEIFNQYSNWETKSDILYPSYHYWPKLMLKAWDCKTWGIESILYGQQAENRVLSQTHHI